MKIIGVHHICLRVQDQEVSRRWYETVLGFQGLDLQPTESQMATWRPAGVRDGGDDASR